MIIKRLEVSHVRNLRPFSLEPSPSLNLFYGENGSGKTSVLEAIHLLGLGRSFRTNKSRRLINDDEMVCTVFGRVGDGQAGIQKRSNGSTELRINGRSDVTTAQLAQMLPLALLDPEFMALLDEGSKPRRQLLDWGVFHVEHGFFPVWQRYQRALKQRNSLLRNGSIGRFDALPWDQELDASAQALHGFRGAYVAQLEPVLTEALACFVPQLDIRLEYLPGWDLDVPLSSQLQDAFERDRERGHTQLGAHRADLKLKVGNVPADEVLSRGQKKMAVCALRLAQVELLCRRDHRPVLLVDDLAAELDREARERLCSALMATGCQVFITAIEAESVLPAFGGKPVKVFHVEHGVVQETGSAAERAVAAD